MGFWTFCCKKQQAYVWGGAQSSFPPSNEYRNTDGLESGRYEQIDRWSYLDSGGRNYPPVQGWRNGPWVDNESDWLCFDYPYAIRSDGTLWNFQSSENSLLSQIEGYPSDYAPAQVGSDSDWASICNRVLLKTDGSIWSIGDYPTGHGVVFSGYNFDGSAFRAVISSPVKAAEVFTESNTYHRPFFTHKPTISLYAKSLSSNYTLPYGPSPQELLMYNGIAAEVTGSGAVIESDWKGQIYHTRIINGGSGYTSAPAVSFIPQDGEEDTGSQFVALLSLVDTEGFNVSLQGEGYTYATATDPYTNATASATISSGRIVSWTLTSRGTKSRNLNEGYAGSLVATVVGDGSGATVLCVPGTASVTALVQKHDPSCWSKPPLVALTGGGGSGATAEVVDLYGRITNLTVASGGSGYTVGSKYAIGVAADGVPVGYVTLSGGPVVRIDGLPSGSVMGNLDAAAIGSTGVVKAFTASFYSAYFDARTFHSAELVGACGKTVPLDAAVASDGSLYGTGILTLSLPQDADGFGTEKPIVRVYRKATYLGTPPSQLAASERVTSTLLSQYFQGWLGGGFGDSISDPSCSPYAFRTVANVGSFGSGYYGTTSVDFDSVPQDGPARLSPTGYYGNPVPAVGSLTATGPSGSSLELYFIDGFAFKSSRSSAVVGTGTLASLQQGLPPATSAAFSVTVSWFDGKIGYEDFELSKLSLLGDQYGGHPQWIPAQQPLIAKVYCSLSNTRYGGGRSEGASVAAGVSNPELSAAGSCGYRTVELSSHGAMYTSEPSVVFCVTSTPYPLRIGSKTWKSVGYTGTKWVAVDSEGKAYHWGFADITKPTPIGRGARIVFSASSYKGAEPFFANRTSSNTITPSWITVQRSNAGRYGSVGGLSWSRVIVDRPRYGTTACGGSGSVIACVQDADYSASTGGQFTFSFKVLGTATHTLGIGYTEPPSVRYLEIDEDNPVADLSSELVGPETFDRVEGCFLIDSSGNSWDANSPQSWDNSWPMCSTTLTVEESREFAAALSGTYSQSQSVVVGNVYRHFSNYISFADLGYSADGSATADLLFAPGSQRLSYGGTEPVTTRVVNGTSQYTQCNGNTITYNSSQTSSTPLTVLLDASTGYTPLSIPYAFNGVSRLPSIAQTSSEPPQILHSNYRELRASNSAEPSTMYRLPQGMRIRQATPAFSVPIDQGVGSMTSFVILEDGRAGWYRSPGPSISPCLFVDPSLGGMTSLSKAGLVARKSASQSLWDIGEWNRNGLYLFLPTPKSKGELSVLLDAVGGGYQRPPVARLTQQRSGVASYEAQIDGKVVSATAVYGGCGFTTPPPLTVAQPSPWLSNAPQAQTATLEAVIEGPVYDTTVVSGGSGYRCAPEVLFSPDGIPAEATANMSTGPVIAVEITNGGSGYVEAPEIVFFGIGADAAATAQISGFVDRVAITNGGGLYSSAPAVSFSGGGGSGAAGIAVVARSNSGYRVTSVILTSPGTGYSSSPVVSFSGGGGSGATAVATINASIVGVTLVSGGSGYDFDTTASAIGGNAELAVSVSSPVESLGVSYAGEYRRNPTISFASRGHIQSVSVIDGGSGYSSRPAVGIVGPCGSGAKASCAISGSVSGITVSNGGSGYTRPPLVELKGGYDPSVGRKAKAHAVCTNGSVTSIVIDDYGDGYFHSPAVHFVSVSQAILECVVEGGTITSVDVIYGGHGYASAPTLRFLGGEGAYATASVSGGSITSVSVSSGGSGYPQQNNLIIESGIGANAAATSTISARVRRVTVVSCGEGFEQNEPVSVFFSGGAGAGASAEATVGFAGSGAAATARINGSVIAVKVTSPGAGYQDSPTVSVDSSGSFAHQNTELGNPEPFVATRVEGVACDGALTSSGEGYTGGLQTYGRIVKNKPSWAQANTSGSVTSVSLSGAFSDLATKKYTSPPNVNFGDNVFLSTSISCLTGAFGHKQHPAPVASQGTYTSKGSVEFHDRDTSPGDFKFAASGIGVALRGSIYTGASVLTRSIAPRSGSWASSINDLIVIPKYNTPPEVSVVDVSGSGCVASFTSENGLVISSGGTAYSLGSTLRFRGGVPSSWVDTPTLSCSLHPTTGVIQGVTVTSRGSGCTTVGSSYQYGYVAAVHADGGGSTDSDTSPVGFLTLQQSGSLSFSFASQQAMARKFSTPPRLIVVPFEQPAHRQTCWRWWTYQEDGGRQFIPINEAIRRNVSLRIANAVPEYIERQQDYPTSISELPASGAAGSTGEWSYYQHFWAGTVDHIWMNSESTFSPRTIYESAPSVVFRSETGGNASAHCEIVRWTDVYSDSMAKRNA